METKNIGETMAIIPELMEVGEGIVIKIEEEMDITMNYKMGIEDL